MIYMFYLWQVWNYFINCQTQSSLGYTKHNTPNLDDCGIFQTIPIYRKWDYKPRSFRKVSLSVLWIQWNKQNAILNKVNLKLTDIYMEGQYKCKYKKKFLETLTKQKNIKVSKIFFWKKKLKKKKPVSVSSIKGFLLNFWSFNEWSTTRYYWSWRNEIDNNSFWLKDTKLSSISWKK